jgi:hypothetical protein
MGEIKRPISENSFTFRSGIIASHANISNSKKSSKSLVGHLGQNGGSPLLKSLPLTSLIRAAAVRDAVAYWTTK